MTIVWAPFIILCAREAKEEKLLTPNQGRSRKVALNLVWEDGCNSEENRS